MKACIHLLLLHTLIVGTQYTYAAEVFNTFVNVFDDSMFLVHLKNHKFEQTYLYKVASKVQNIGINFQQAIHVKLAY